MSEIGDNRLAVLAGEIRTSHAGVKAAAEIAAAHAIAAGQALIEAKALVGHGKWLPWLKVNCGFSERTAQLYMGITENGVSATIVAALGLKSASSAFTIEDEFYDPFTGCCPDQRRRWLTFACFVGSWTHCEWVIQKQFASPDEWLGPVGETQRKFWGMRPVSDACREEWAKYSAENRETSEQDLTERLNAIESEAERLTAQRPKPRRRKSAPVADFARPRTSRTELAERLRQALAVGDVDGQRAEIAAIAAELDGGAA